jgi:hypothetical protein
MVFLFGILFCERLEYCSAREIFLHLAVFHMHLSLVKLEHRQFSCGVRFSLLALGDDDDDDSFSFLSLSYELCRQ